MIIITGGAGFVGSMLAQKLHEKNVQFRLVDSKEPKNFKDCFVRADITQYEELLKVLSENDIVVHLAALTNAHESNKKKKTYFKVNVEGTFNVVSACQEKECKKIIFTSSVAVYDPEQKGVIREDSPLKPQNFYGVSKMLGEILVKTSGIDHVILRPSNGYGKGGHGVINTFVEKIKKGEHIEIWGSGNQERDYLHINDFVNAIMLAVENGHGTYNISAGRNASVNEIVELIKKNAGRSIKVKKTQVNEKEIHYSISNQKAKQELGFEPKVSLEEGIKGLL